MLSAAVFGPALPDRRVALDADVGNGLTTAGEYHPDVIDGEQQNWRPRSTLHLPNAFCSRTRGLDESQLSLPK